MRPKLTRNDYIQWPHDVKESIEDVDEDGDFQMYLDLLNALKKYNPVSTDDEPWVIRHPEDSHFWRGKVSSTVLNPDISLAALKTDTSPAVTIAVKTSTGEVE